MILRHTLVSFVLFANVTLTNDLSVQTGSWYGQDVPLHQNEVSLQAFKSYSLYTPSRIRPVIIEFSQNELDRGNRGSLKQSFCT